MIRVETTHTATYTCDRCARTVLLHYGAPPPGEVMTEAPTPDGWVQVKVQRIVDGAAARPIVHLCESCADAHGAFLDTAPGGEG